VALLADPVVQARTPALVNAALAARGLDAVLVPLEVPRDALATVLAAIRRIQTFRGAVVSMPHKTALLDHLDDVTHEGRQVGACNVVRREADGRLAGTMLDGAGFVAGLHQAGHEVRGKRVFMAGAGGAAAGIAFALAEHGAARLTVRNRTRARALDLVRRVRIAWPDVDARVGDDGPTDDHLLVNATSLGMRPGDALPIDPTRLGPGVVAAEVVLAPVMTAFLEAAQLRGATVHVGEAMLAAQIDLIVDFLFPRPNGLA
jgi:shikimate dehydrogenase